MSILLELGEPDAPSARIAKWSATATGPAAAPPHGAAVGSRVVAERDGVAGKWLRVEAKPSTMSRRRRIISFVLHLLSEFVPVPVKWPPVDVVLIDMRTSRILKTWHEGGEDASILVSVLNEELADMPYGEFMDKWDICWTS